MGSEIARVKLADVSDMWSGGTPSKDRADYWDGDLPWVSAKDMKQRRLRDAEDHITQSGLASASRVAPVNATLVLVRGMTLLNDVPICSLAREMAFNQDVKAIIPTKEIEPDYLTYALLASKPELLSMVELAGHGTGRLPTDRLKALQIPLPSKRKQRSVADILRVLDDKIELNWGMNETLEAIARAIFKSWFVNFEPAHAKMEGRWRRGESLPGLPANFYDLFPSSFEDSALGKVPVGWAVRALGECVRVIGGSTPHTEEPSFWQDGIYHFATPKDLSQLNGPFLSITERTITDAGLAQVGSGLLPIGTVLLSSRAPIGYLAIADLPVVVNQGIAAMVCDGDMPNYYVYFWVKDNLDTILNHANGTTFLEISKGNFRKVEALTPSPAVFKAFRNLVAPLFDQIANTLKESRMLARIRDALLPKLVSGEIGVTSTELSHLENVR